MEQEIRNDALSDIMCDLLYLLGCGVNEKRLISRHFRKHTTKTKCRRCIDLARLILWK